MSFSSEVKTDLVRVKLKSEKARLSQLTGLTKACGSLCIARSGKSIIYKTESLDVGRHITVLAESLFALDTTIELSRFAHRANPLAIVTLSGAGVDALLAGTGVLPHEDGELLFEGSLPKRLVTGDECKKALLRGAFLGSGSVNNPKRYYHLEIVSRTAPFSETLTSLLSDFDLSAKRSSRKERELVYLKGPDVAGFLALIGANAGVLEVESARAEKDYRNYINRATNCEAANIGKTVDASVAQRTAIERIEDKIGVKSLPTPLYEAAMLRLNHPNATLSELADLADIGKSGMNHRLTRLMRIAKDLEEA